MLSSVVFLPLSLILPSSLLGDHVCVGTIGTEPGRCHLILNPLAIKRNTGKDPHRSGLNVNSEHTHVN